jgi:hypothetical protein
LLGNAILEMHVYTTKGELLLCVMAGLWEDVVVEMPIVAVVVLDSHTALAYCSKVHLLATVSADES